VLEESDAIPGGRGRAWAVGALCRAVAESLDARFNPVAVRGEISGFSRAASGHCYFSLKDPQGQIRCAMFRRAAALLPFVPREGDLVEVQGRLAVYEPRGDLQLIVESLERAGQGALFEQFLRLKARLEAQGLFDPARKRELPVMSRGIGIVTSLGAAALHDVVTCLRRRAPHVPVVVAPAAVQGAQAPRELMDALSALYARAEAGELDVILLVRGGGSIEDLWAFNDERLAHCIVRSPVPVVVGVGHETDFTIADFCADVRAPTPTAAAELAAQPRQVGLSLLEQLEERLRQACWRRLDGAGQRLDQVAVRLGRPSGRTARQHLVLERAAQRLRFGVGARVQRSAAGLDALGARLERGVQRRLDIAARQLDGLGLRLQLLDPRLVLQRGYALLIDEAGHPVTSAGQVRPGQALRGVLADGEVDLRVEPARSGNPP